MPLFGVLVVVRGHDADWDFRNYHWYDAYAWLTGRRGFDLAVAHHATYYNPLADVPVYLAAQVMPAWLVGFLVGCVHGLNLLVLYRLAHHALDARANTRSEWLALAIAVAGTTGGMFLILVGNASNDLTVSILILLALLAIVRDEAAETTRRDLPRFVLAGLAVGSAIGLKLTMAPFAFGIATGAFAMRAPLRNRLQRVACIGAGGVIGALAFGGAWAFALWRETGNPFFPYFNDVIGSPLVLAASYRDERFLPHGIVEYLFYPFVFSAHGLRVNDNLFRDVKIALAYVLVPLAIAWAVARRPRGVRVLTPAMQLLFTFAIVSYLVWMNIFGVYRYIVTLEILAPLLIALALTCAIADDVARLRALAILWVVAVIGTGWPSVAAVDGHWRGRYVDVTHPLIADPSHTLVVVAGLEPMGYIVPSFPPEIPFLRIDGWLDSPQSHSAFGDRMRARIDAHAGPIFGVFSEHERERALAAFAADGLVLAANECDTITSNVGEPLQWCELERKSDGH